MVMKLVIHNDRASPQVLESSSNSSATKLLVWSENTNLRESITVWLTSSLFCLDLAALLMLNKQHFYLFGQIQKSQTGQPFIETCLYCECSLFYTEICLWNRLLGLSPKDNFILFFKQSHWLLKVFHPIRVFTGLVVLIPKRHFINEDMFFVSLSFLSATENKVYPL